MNLIKQYSILIVEDERIVAMDLRQTLADMGYDAFAVASSADEAIVRASERCPDVVLMDIRIKGSRDGIQTAEILKERFGAPIVYLTAHADEATIERAKKTEPYGYLLKPVKSAELRCAIEVALYKYEMEKRLRERERLFSTTLRSIGDAVVAVDLAGNITFMNRAAEELIGLPAVNAIGKSSTDILRLVDEQSVEIGEPPLTTVLRDMQPLTLPEANLLNLSTGVFRSISDTTAPVIDEGYALGAVMVFRDVTEQKSLQKSLKKSLQKQLELADRLASLGTMAAGVAHEVNNPLTVAAANASFVLEEMRRILDVLRAGDRTDEAVRALEDVLQAQMELQSAMDRIGRIVADLKTFSRPSERTVDATNVRRAIEWAVRVTAREIRSRARLVVDAPELPSARADESRLGQILINLLMNAAQAIDPGNVEGNMISISAHADENEQIVIDVSDTGCGMSTDVLQHIFEPFFTTKPVGLGTGLGLSISHGIINSFGGRLQVESTVGSGSTFRVILATATSETGNGILVDPKPDKVLLGRILVVDDEELILRLIARLLRDHDVVCTPSARDALGIIEREEKFDLILCDVMMPMMTGIEFYETLMSSNPDMAHRVAFLSGGAVTATVEDFLRSVPNRRIEKPFHCDHLREVVQEALAAS